MDGQQSADAVAPLICHAAVPTDADIVLFPGNLGLPRPLMHRVARRARVLAGAAYDDASNNGDDRVTWHSTWQLFHRFPVATWPLGCAWRRLAARTFDDLAAEFAAGAVYPRTIGEHVALALIIEDSGIDGGAKALFRIRAQLVDDDLVSALHNPGSAQARAVSADPARWFAPRIPGLDRDPSRGFRR